MLARADASLERLVENIARSESLFERSDADPLGALSEQPAGKLGHLVARAMQRDEPVRIDIFARRRDRAEALGCGARRPRLSWRALDARGAVQCPPAPIRFSSDS